LFTSTVLWTCPLINHTGLTSTQISQNQKYSSFYTILKNRPREYLRFLMPLKPEGKGSGKNEIRTKEAVRHIRFNGENTEI
jgi:hypothetical protein